jgi:crotonobetainyl-CoA:carnitine CoA-transferase CaiB-like acyl-CoA transferase
MITGSLAGMLLGDLGASIVKIEKRETGDTLRGAPVSLYSSYFTSYNRNKRSLTLDLQQDEGRKILFELIEKADVLIDNYRPGVLGRLGLTPDALSETNPRLIHASITGFGESGPYRNRPAYDPVAQSLSGVLSQFLDADRPQPVGPSLSDNITGYYTAYGILGALFEREKSNRGKRLEVNMLEATIAFMPDPFLSRRRHDTVTTPTSRVEYSQTFCFRCADGKLVSVHMSSQAKFWTGVVQAVRRPELLTDARFSSRAQRVKHYFELRDELARSFATQTRDEWERRLEAEDVPYAPVLTVDEVFEDAQVRHLGTFFSMPHPTEGDVLSIRPPLLVNGSRPAMHSAPPALGEHTEAILAELGRARSEIEALKSKKVV